MHPGRADAAHDDIDAFKCLRNLVNIIRLDVVGQPPPQPRMPAFLQARGNDLTVEMGSYQADLVAIIAQRPSHRRPHHSRAYNRYIGHIAPTIN